MWYIAAATTLLTTFFSLTVFPSIPLLLILFEILKNSLFLYGNINIIVPPPSFWVSLFELKGLLYMLRQIVDRNDDDNELLLWDGWLTNSWRLYFQKGPSSGSLTMVTSQHTEVGIDSGLLKQPSVVLSLHHSSIGNYIILWVILRVKLTGTFITSENSDNNFNLS